MHTEKLVMRIVAPNDNTSYDISFWKNYGSVAPKIWTTNGSHAYVAKYVSEYVKLGGWQIIDSILPKDLDYTDVEAIKNALRIAYIEFNEWAKQDETL